MKLLLQYECTFKLDLTNNISGDIGAFSETTYANVITVPSLKRRS